MWYDIARLLSERLVEDVANGKYRSLDREMSG
jgi:hypothetical protein